MQNHVFKSPFRDGVKLQFAHQRYPDPKGSADYDTAKKGKIESNVKLD